MSDSKLLEACRLGWRQIHFQTRQRVHLSRRADDEMPSHRISGADVNREHQIDRSGDAMGCSHNEWQVQSVLLNSGEWEWGPDTLFRVRFARDALVRVHPVVLGIGSHVSNLGAHELSADIVLFNVQTSTTSLAVDVSR